MKRFFLVLILITGGLLFARTADYNEQNVSLYFSLRDPTDGTAHTGLTVTGFDLYYWYEGGSVQTKIDCTDLGSENAAHSDGGCYEMGTLGDYRVDVPDVFSYPGDSVHFKLVWDTVNNRSETIEVAVLPPVDVSYWNGSSGGVANWQIVYSTDFATGYDQTTNMWNVDVENMGGVVYTTAVTNRCKQAMLDYGLDHIVYTAIVDGSEVTDDSLWALLTSKAATADYSAGFDHTTDSLEAIRDKQTDIETDTAEIGVAGGGLTALSGLLNTILGDTQLWDTSAEARTLLYGSDTPGATASGVSGVPAATWAYSTRTLSDKTGFSLAADQSGVTFGTVNAFAAGAAADLINVDTGLTFANNVSGSFADVMRRLVWETSITGTDYSGTEAGKRLLNISSTFELTTGTAQAGSASTLQLAAGSNANDNYYQHAICVIIAGTGAGQARSIDTYTGATVTANIVPNWVTNPDATSEYVILADSEKHVYEVHDGAITAGSFAAGAIDAAALNADAVDEFFDEVIEGGNTFRQMQRVNSAVLSGTSTVTSTAFSFTGIDDSTVRFAGTLSAGSRTAVTTWDGD